MEEENWEEREKRAFYEGLFGGLFVAVLLGIFLICRYEGVFDRLFSAETEQQLLISRKDTQKKIKEIQDLINYYYLDEIDSQDVEEWMYTGLMAGLHDPYAAYYTEEELAKVQDSANGYYEGIGATMSQNRETGEITVVKCYENGPALESGLLPGDVILNMNGMDVGGMKLSDLVREIKTGESDEIQVTVKREGEDVPLIFSMIRRVVDVPTVSKELLDGNIGYLLINEFDDITISQFAEAKKELEEAGMEKLIIDLRNNPGGNLKSVVEILKQILPKGLIVYTEDKHGNRMEYESEGETPLAVPLAVLINGQSASASEIFAGAVKDYGIGTLVGTTTFGKGIVQRSFNLSDGTAIKLTIAKYYTPKGNDIHEKGVEPDIEAELSEDVKTLSEIPREQDNQLKKAIEILEEQ